MSQPLREAELGSAWEEFMSSKKDDLIREYIQDNYPDFEDYCREQFNEHISSLN